MFTVGNSTFTSVNEIVNSIDSSTISVLNEPCDDGEVRNIARTILDGLVNDTEPVFVTGDIADIIDANQDFIIDFDGVDVSDGLSLQDVGCIRDKQILDLVVMTVTDAVWLSIIEHAVPQ